MPGQGGTLMQADAADRPAGACELSWDSRPGRNALRVTTTDVGFVSGLYHPGGGRPPDAALRASMETPPQDDSRERCAAVGGVQRATCAGMHAGTPGPC